MEKLFPREIITIRKQNDNDNDDDDNDDNDNNDNNDNDDNDEIKLTDNFETQASWQQQQQQQQQIVKSRLSYVKEVFSRNPDDIGCAGVTKHRIELYDDTPIRQKPRRFPEPVAREIERQCEDLRRLNVLDYSKSPFSAPIVPIRKKNGQIRLCIDYRELNKVTKPDRFPIPNMSDLVYGLNGMRYFSTLDLTKGYYQVPLDSESAEYTAFSTSRNHYQFKRLSFGLKNAPGAFQREMQAVLESLFRPRFRLKFFFETKRSWLSLRSRRYGLCS